MRHVTTQKISNVIKYSKIKCIFVCFALVFYMLLAFYRYFLDSIEM